MGEVRRIGTDFPKLIADGLEQLARDIRNGEMDAHRVFLIVGIKMAGEDLIAGHMYGAEASTAEMVGMLELMKAQVIEQA